MVPIPYVWHTGTWDPAGPVTWGDVTLAKLGPAEGGEPISNACRGDLLLLLLGSAVWSWNSVREKYYWIGWSWWLK